jgi:hypothetical protein
MESVTISSDVVKVSQPASYEPLCRRMRYSGQYNITGYTRIIGPNLQHRRTRRNSAQFGCCCAEYNAIVVKKDTLYLIPMCHAPF